MSSNIIDLINTRTMNRKMVVNALNNFNELYILMQDDTHPLIQSEKNGNHEIFLCSSYEYAVLVGMKYNFPVGENGLPLVGRIDHEYLWSYLKYLKDNTNINAINIEDILRMLLLDECFEGQILSQQGQNDNNMLTMLKNKNLRPENNERIEKENFVKLFKAYQMMCEMTDADEIRSLDPEFKIDTYLFEMMKKLDSWYFGSLGSQDDLIMFESPYNGLMGLDCFTDAETASEYLSPIYGDKYSIIEIKRENFEEFLSDMKNNNRKVFEINPGMNTFIENTFICVDDQDLASTKQMIQEHLEQTKNYMYRDDD